MNGMPALRRRLIDVVSEYEHKSASMLEALKAFHTAEADLISAATVGGTFGSTISTGRIYERELRNCLLKSAWRHVYEGLNIHRLASPDDKRRFHQHLEQPPAFTPENIRSTFERYIIDPRGSILRALAEVFCALDPAYKSHDKVKIGVAGLPKRVIIHSVGGFGSYGKDRIESILNALAAYQGKPLVTWSEISALMDNECALLKEQKHTVKGYGVGDDKIELWPARGVRLRIFGNKNGHLFFEPDTLRDVNKALAEFYGDVLPDTTDEKPSRPRAGTDVAKDLQYYPTPVSVVTRLFDRIYSVRGKRVLDPSCGCGRILDEVKKQGAVGFGIEVDAARAAISRAKGHDVLTANFLETIPTEDFDFVVMNPPFYGKHYAKHIDHAMKFLRAGGTLVSVLPVTARYDHGLVDGTWEDLPVAAFAESGTNINTTILTKRKS